LATSYFVEFAAPSLAATHVLRLVAVAADDVAVLGLS
jgi:hypothetical protein